MAVCPQPSEVLICPLLTGLYPLIGWKIKDELVYLAEGSINDTGIMIEWAQSLGMTYTVYNFELSQFYFRPIEIGD